MRKHLRNLTVGLIANYDFLRTETSYNPGYVYGQVTVNLAIILRLQFVGLLGIIFSIALGIVGLYSFKLIAVMMLIGFVLSLVFIKSENYLRRDRFEHWLTLEMRIPENLKKRLRKISTQIFLLNITLFVVEMILAKIFGSALIAFS